MMEKVKFGTFDVSPHRTSKRWARHLDDLLGQEQPMGRIKCADSKEAKDALSSLCQTIKRRGAPVYVTKRGDTVYLVKKGV